MTDLNQAIDDLFDAIVDDYRRFCVSSDITSAKLSVDRFHAGLNIEEGRKYIKVISGDIEGDQTTVWGFIVKKDGGKFRAGDLLKAASWSSPATNKARGNILDGGYEIRWTGPLYL